MEKEMKGPNDYTPLSVNSIALSSRGLGFELINDVSDSLPDRRSRRSQLYVPAKAFHQRAQNKTYLAAIGIPGRNLQDTDLLHRQL